MYLSSSQDNGVRLPKRFTKDLCLKLSGKRSVKNDIVYVSVSAQLHPTLCDPSGPVARRLLCPWNFPGKNTGVGCHFLLQGISQPRDQTCVSCVGRRFLYCWATNKAPSGRKSKEQSKPGDLGLSFVFTLILINFAVMTLYRSVQHSVPGYARKKPSKSLCKIISHPSKSRSFPPFGFSFSLL